MYRRSSTRQPTVSTVKQTHLRIKTQGDCIKIHREGKNPFQRKKPLRTCRISEFQHINQDRILPSVEKNRKPVAQRSIFGQFNIHMPKFKKQHTSHNNLQHPLKGYIAQLRDRGLKKFGKRYKTGANEQSQKSICKSMAFPTERSNTETKDKPSKQFEVLFQLIDQIYKKIDKFKQVGYTQKKINEWIQKYCLQRRKYMTNLLMKASSKYKFSQTYQDYFFQRDAEKVKQKLPYANKKVNGIQRPIDQYDLIQFSNYIQQILIQKNRLKINQIKESIADKLDQCFIYNRQSNEYQFGKKLYPADLLNFVSDLQQIQQTHGRFERISGFNREYFMDLGRSQKKVRMKIYELIKVTQNKKKEVMEEEREVGESLFKRLHKMSMTNNQVGGGGGGVGESNFGVIQVCDAQLL